MLGENPKQLKNRYPSPLPGIPCPGIFEGVGSGTGPGGIRPGFGAGTGIPVRKAPAESGDSGKTHRECTVRRGKHRGKCERAVVPVFAGPPSPPCPPILPLHPCRCVPRCCVPGCPHRASFYAVKQAMKGKKAVFCGDIGCCYTLGNAQPLDMVDTCLCMGAGITIAQGIARADGDTVPFAFVGDSTFFHTGIPGVVNAVYNGTKLVLIVLDNAHYCHDRASAPSRNG